LGIQIESKLESEVPPIQRISVEDVFFANSLGIPIEPTINEQIQIVGMIHNNQNYNQSFVFITQIKDQDGVVVSLSWILGELSSNQSLELSQSWIPTEFGNYTIETFVWNSLQDQTSLSQNSTMSYLIQ
jgi:hypothetical protein